MSFFIKFVMSCACFVIVHRNTTMWNKKHCVWSILWCSISVVLQKKQQEAQIRVWLVSHHSCDVLLLCLWCIAKYCDVCLEMRSAGKGWWECTMRAKCYLWLHCCLMLCRSRSPKRRRSSSRSGSRGRHRYRKGSYSSLSSRWRHLGLTT